MDRAELMAYCLGKPGAWLDQPWDAEVVVKVGNKIFAFLGPESDDRVGLKCAPTRELADEWLHRFPGDAVASSHVGRFGWNSLRLAGAIDDDELREAVDTSYEAVAAKLPRRERPMPPTA
ncbi:MmcQ/YjbR family DNA-binding protein [Micromonospora sp. WMMD712]|uniref:MmcQ/YjbR family DNA-binding protein n=1 Tax=Micromonospora sp. WMMD712 TaxID=3016096 RepID=UPI00249C2A82|nr:MmcQ/YjbR family DNA-binding protein [Micromonospora sp. WMMD712]WFE56710.1 MmcQ/YjbR family DNA-binding protein [Micromonospora sp. WMMD712]